MLALPAPAARAYLDHLDRYPPLEVSIPVALATLSTIVARALGSKGTRPEHFLPWVQWRDRLPAARAAAKRATRRRMVAAVAAAFERERGRYTQSVEGG